jgi:hypothetical protein
MRLRVFRVLVLFAAALAAGTGTRTAHAAQPAPGIAAPSPEPASLSPAVVASITRAIPTHVSQAPTVNPVSNGTANLLGAEQADVIVTDDRFYPRYRHDSDKISPLTGLPFARNTSEEFVAATTTNIMLRDPHRSKLLKWTSYAYPVLERAVVGSMFHYWKAYKV